MFDLPLLSSNNFNYDINANTLCDIALLHNSVYPTHLVADIKEITGDY